MTYERENIRRMQGYVWGEQPTDADTCKLNTNENPYPPSPAVQHALADFNAEALRTYPQPTADPLRAALAEHHGLERDNVIVANGGDEGLRLAITTFVEPGTPLGTAPPSYSLYPVLADIHDAPVAEAELTGEWAAAAGFRTAHERGRSTADRTAESARAVRMPVRHRIHPGSGRGNWTAYC